MHTACGRLSDLCSFAANATICPRTCSECEGGGGGGVVPYKILQGNHGNHCQLLTHHHLHFPSLHCLSFFFNFIIPLYSKSKTRQTKVLLRFAKLGLCHYAKINYTMQQRKNETVLTELVPTHMTHSCDKCEKLRCYQRRKGRSR